MIPCAPASLAFLAALAVMIPFKINGISAIFTISFNSSTDLLPAGGFRFCRKGSPAASISIATANAPLALTSSSFSRIVSISHGLMVGIPLPFAFRIAAVASIITFGSVPSPVNAAMPF